MLRHSHSQNQLRLKPQPTTQNDIPVRGSHTFTDIEQIITATYDEIVHRRTPIFLLPSGKAGKPVYYSRDNMSAWYLDKRVTVIQNCFKGCHLYACTLLQKPKYNSKARDHKDWQVDTSRGKSRVSPQFWLPMECVECLECVTSLVTKVTQRVFCFQASM